MTRITKHLVNLQNRIAAACDAHGRNVNDVSILAVSKRHGVDRVHEARDAGLTMMGENYLQEALEKMPLCPADIEWHYIGRVQSNKTRALAENFMWVQTVAGEKAARRLDAQRPASLPPLNVCVQVRVDEDSGHGGIAPDETGALCRLIAGLPNLRLRGLMTIPQPAATFDEQCIPFQHLRRLYDGLRDDGLELDTLSMGMTGDLEAAIAEGSTMVRIGTALFGQRPS